MNDLVPKINIAPRFLHDLEGKPDVTGVIVRVGSKTIQRELYTTSIFLVFSGSKVSSKCRILNAGIKGSPLTPLL